MGTSFWRGLISAPRTDRIRHRPGVIQTISFGSPVSGRVARPVVVHVSALRVLRMFAQALTWSDAASLLRTNQQLVTSESRISAAFVLAVTVTPAMAALLSGGAQ
jgi:hypothetical protein